MQIISPAFRDGAPIPPQYTCKGPNVNPPLNILEVPASTKSLALIMHDPDAPIGDYVHWTIWDMPPTTETIAANSVPVGAIQGLNSSGENKYTGPCPPSGIHRYIFDLYALNSALSLPAATDRGALLNALKDRIIELSALTGTFGAQNDE
jgi:hypothetical protein